MSKWRKKPVVVDAFRWTGDERQTEDPDWIVEAIKDGRVRVTTFDALSALHQMGLLGGLHSYLLCMVIHTLEGEMRVDPGDYIIRGAKGEIYPCKPDIFEATYELVEEES